MPLTDKRHDNLYWEKVERARAMDPEEKLLAGIRLFEYACEITKAGIRHQHPEATEDEVLTMPKERLALRRKLDEQEFQRIHGRLREGNQLLDANRDGLADQVNGLSK